MTLPFKKLHVISLGCPKNLADTENILGGLEGFLGPLKITASFEEADVILINTCSFLEASVSESIETILEVSQKKKEGAKIIVFGCLPLRYGERLKGLIPEVDEFLFEKEPPDITKRLFEVLNSYKTKREYPILNNRIITGSPYYAYVKISDGCPNRCTYCLIPKIKGHLRCKPPFEIKREIEGLLEKGVREITLVAQDLTAYQYEGLNLEGILREILSIKKDFWLRLMYLYPKGISKGLLRLIRDEERICNYLDIPIQHASTRVLKRMGRGYERKDLDRLLGTIREIIPDISLRTTVMVGFPGERDEDFDILLESIKKWRFHYLGCFTYSDEEEAPSHKLKEKVNKELAQKRRDEILRAQEEISLSINRSFIGKSIETLVLGRCEETELLICGRARFQADDVDGMIYINRGDARAGEFQRVLVTEAHSYDLVGEV